MRIHFFCDHTNYTNSNVYFSFMHIPPFILVCNLTLHACKRLEFNYFHTKVPFVDTVFILVLFFSLIILWAFPHAASEIIWPTTTDKEEGLNLDWIYFYNMCHTEDEKSSNTKQGNICAFIYVICKPYITKQCLNPFDTIWNMCMSIYMRIFSNASTLAWVG